MKKSIILIIFVFIITVVQSQTIVSWGIKGGLNRSNLNNYIGFMHIPEPDYAARFSPFIGGLINLQFKKHFALQTELTYSLEGASIFVFNEPYLTLNYIKLNYINIPVLFQLKLGNEFRVYSGPQIGFLAFGKWGNQNITKDFSRFDFSLAFGSAYKFKNGMGLDARYNIGVNQYSNLRQDIFSSVFQFGVFYQFKSKVQPAVDSKINLPKKESTILPADSASKTYVQIDSNKIKFILDIPILDMPANIKYNGLSFRQLCPGMQQSLGLSKSFGEIQQYYTKRLFFNPSKRYTLKRKVFKEIGLTFTNIGVEFFLSYIPLGTGWLHEEWHRAVMNNNNVRSYDDINKFPIFAYAVNVSHETDEDLARFKLLNNKDFVRMQVAGIEAQYEYVKALQKDNFYYNLKLSSQVSYLLNIYNCIDYVQFCSTKQSDIETIQSEKDEGTNIKVRDFTGWDMTGWIYDLSRPDEAYAARGIHSSGIGIRRYRLTTDLTTEEFNYLERMGKRQRLNLISPHLIGVNSIKFNQNFRFNFGMFHYLTSFGDDAGINFFVDHKKRFLFFAIHNYRNLNNNFYGIEAQLIDKEVQFHNIKFLLSPSLNLWTQPENQAFRTSAAVPGGRAEIKIATILGKMWYPYLTVSVKTKGWVAGDVYLNSNLSTVFGISGRIFTKKRQ